MDTALVEGVTLISVLNFFLIVDCPRVDLSVVYGDYT